MLPNSATDTVALPAPLLRLPAQEAFLRTLGRRVITIPAFLLAAALTWLATPFVLLIGVPIDLVLRRRMATARAWLMVVTFFTCEAAGIIATGWIWLRHRDRERFLDANFRLQCWWAGTLYRAGVRLFSLKVTIENAEVAATGPVIVMSRHVSPIDNLLPAVLISDRFGLRLRWVINRSLLRDPCLDIVGNRLPNCFVANSSGDSEREIRRVETLGRTLGPNDGVLIFPEGGLYSPARYRRVIDRLEASGDRELLARARRLRNVLPPRLGGSLALLEAARGVDVVFMAHTGLEDSTSYHAILQGGLIGREVRVHFWRVPASEIPTEASLRTTWFLDQWEALDAWVTEASSQEPVHA